MRNDAIDMEVNEELFAFWAEEEVAVGGVVHEEVFGEAGGFVSVKNATLSRLGVGKSATVISTAEGVL